MTDKTEEPTLIASALARAKLKERDLQRQLKEAEDRAEMWQNAHDHSQQDARTNLRGWTAEIRDHAETKKMLKNSTYIPAAHIITSTIAAIMATIAAFSGLMP